MTLLTDLIFRTEDLRSDEVLDLFAESTRDREIVSALKARNPVVLVGSRGVGKSFLLRVAEAELKRDFGTDRVVPVYLSFTRSSLLRARDSAHFQHWMLAKLCTRLVRSLRAVRALESGTPAARLLAGDDTGGEGAAATSMELLENAFEQSWQHPAQDIDASMLPTVDALKDALEDVAVRAELRRFVVLFDEAAHVFIPEQQRAFFTLFRDLRSSLISCKAAVYPGVTAFGETFQPAHDATTVVLDRDVLDRSAYVDQMREIVSKQAGSVLLADILKNAEMFAVLAYAASGNPRLLLKTLARADKLTRDSVNTILRTFYRTELWAEHTALGEKYRGHQPLIDWGRSFVEDEVLKELRARFLERSEHGRTASAFFWIHKDAPESVREAMRLLAYTGIVTEHSTGIKATRSEIGTRYLVNLGILFSGLEPPASQGYELASALDPRRMIEYGVNYPAFARIHVDVREIGRGGFDAALQVQLEKSLDVLDITEWQKAQLRSLGLATVSDVLNSSEHQLRRAYYVGEKRSRRIRNAAIAAVFEYLSG